MKTDIEYHTVIIKSGIQGEKTGVVNDKESEEEHIILFQEHLIFEISKL